MFKNAVLKKALELVFEQLIKFAEEYTHNKNSISPMYDFFNQFSVYIYTYFNNNALNKGDQDYFEQIAKLNRILKDKGL